MFVSPLFLSSSSRRDWPTALGGITHQRESEASEESDKQTW